MEERKILHTIKREKANWIGHILRRNFLKHVSEGKIEGRIEVTRRRERRGKQLLDDIKEIKVYWKLKKEILDRTVENSLWKRLWTCRVADYELRDNLQLWPRAAG
jgi:hypothetical protein